MALLPEHIGPQLRFLRRLEHLGDFSERIDAGRGDGSFRRELTATLLLGALAAAPAPSSTAANSDSLQHARVFLKSAQKRKGEARRPRPIVSLLARFTFASPNQTLAPAISKMPELDVEALAVRGRPAAAARTLQPSLSPPVATAVVVGSRCVLVVG